MDIDDGDGGPSTVDGLSWAGYLPVNSAPCGDTIIVPQKYTLSTEEQSYMHGEEEEEEVCQYRSILGI
jgi:hypothetical protein